MRALAATQGRKPVQSQPNLRGTIRHRSRAPPRARPPRRCDTVRRDQRVLEPSLDGRFRGDEELGTRGVYDGGGGGDPLCVFFVGEGLEVSDGLIELAATSAPLHRLGGGDAFGPPGLVGSGGRWLDRGNVLAKQPLVTLFVVLCCGRRACSLREYGWSVGAVSGRRGKTVLGRVGTVVVALDVGLEPAGGPADVLLVGDGVHVPVAEGCPAHGDQVAGDVLADLEGHEALDGRAVARVLRQAEVALAAHEALIHPVENLVVVRDLYVLQKAALYEVGVVALEVIAGLARVLVGRGYGHLGHEVLDGGVPLQRPRTLGID